MSHKGHLGPGLTGRPPSLACLWFSPPCALLGQGFLRDLVFCVKREGSFQKAILQSLVFWSRSFLAGSRKGWFCEQLGTEVQGGLIPCWDQTRTPTCSLRRGTPSLPRLPLLTGELLELKRKLPGLKNFKLGKGLKTKTENEQKQAYLWAL